MSFTAKFIVCRFVEFKAEDGSVIRGYIPYVLNTETDEIIKCRLVKSAIDKKIGDDIDVLVNIRGNFVKYEVI